MFIIFPSNLLFNILYFRQACSRVHSCGHVCGGLAGEAPQCLPCLHGCAGLSTLKQDADDMCMICFTEALSAQPSIQLACGHVFHAQCCRTALKKRWMGPRITFGFAQCPICKADIWHPVLGKVSIIKQIDKILFTPFFETLFFNINLSFILRELTPYTYYQKFESERRLFFPASKRKLLWVAVREELGETRAHMQKPGLCIRTQVKETLEVVSAPRPLIIRFTAWDS